MRVGIIGCGNIAAFHLPHILSHPDVRVLSLLDVNRQIADQLARRFGLTNTYSDLDLMLAKEKPDVVHVLTPPASHAELATKAMKLGCHVLVEKPMALTIEDADRMIGTARDNAVKLCVNHNFLFDPSIIKVRNLVCKGLLGRIVHVEAQYSFDIRRFTVFDANDDSSGHWLSRLSGGPLSDTLAHPLSILLHFLDDPVNAWPVKKSNGLLPDNMPDELRVLIDAGDMTGSLAVSLGIKPDCFSVNLFGTEMSVHVNLSNMTVIIRKNRHIPKALLRAADNFDQALQLTSCTISTAINLLRKKIGPPGDIGPLIARFYESVENGTEVPTTGEEGRAVVKWMNQIWQHC